MPSRRARRGPAAQRGREAREQPINHIISHQSISQCTPGIREGRGASGRHERGEVVGAAAEGPARPAAHSPRQRGGRCYGGRAECSGGGISVPGPGGRARQS
eukprot:scaffold185_cov321-Prasinococcus_capsulatus_cf.AAC.13